jgi:ribosome-associated protein
MLQRRDSHTVAMPSSDTAKDAAANALPTALEPREDEMQFSAIRAQGPGGQNVHKVSNAMHLRYDITASALPEAVKARLLALGDQRITAEGVVVIKAQAHRSLERNRAEAIERLRALIAAAAQPPKPRRATRPTRASQRRRVEGKLLRGQTKALRGKAGPD